MISVPALPNYVLRCGFGPFLWLLLSITALAGVPRPQTDARTTPLFLRTVERAAPARRVILLLNYFDTCRAVTQDRAYASQLLTAVHALGQRTGDEQLIRYGRFVNDTYAKHSHRSNAEKAALFLAVGQRAEADDDPQTAAVCRHFAGQYYFLNEEYGRAFEHLLAANRAFRELGSERIPELSRYLYELAFNYYHFGEYEKTIRLLKEAARYPAYNDNLAIQTHNTMGMAYSQLYLSKRTDGLRKAEQCYQKARQTAVFYRDSLWIGLIAGQLAGLYRQQGQWDAALSALRTDYAFGLKFGTDRGMPNQTALNLALIYAHRQQWDSCDHFLHQSMMLYRLNVTNRASADFGRSLLDEQYRKGYYDVRHRYYRAVNNLPKAYVYLDSLNRLNDHINKRLNTKQIALAEQKLLIQKHQLTVAALENEKDIQRWLFWISGVVLALVALLFFLRWRFVRIKRRQDQVINAEQAKSLRFEKQLIEHELQRAKADLTVFIDNLREKNAFIDTITAELETLSQLQRQSREQQQIAEAQQNLLDSSLLTNDGWDEFRRRFERVYPGFFVQVRNQFADISPAEERLLALSKLRIDTRQMSRMLGISPESIRKTKYRMRKKLGPDGASHIVELLADNRSETVLSYSTP